MKLPVPALPSTPRWQWPTLLLILLLAALLRGNGIAQGLPGIYDPDEPLFLINGLDLLARQTLQPAWFGHPGTTTLYLLAGTDVAVFLAGKAAGRWADVAGFTAQLYADPSAVVLPARLLIAAMGVAVVAATARLGAALGSAGAGLVAALLLAVSPLHVEISGLVRTDIMASLFGLLGLLAGVKAVNSGRALALAPAGAWLGLAVATKWPAGLFLLGPALAWALAQRRSLRRALLGIAGLALVMLTTMLVLMPPLWLRPLAVAAALGAEVQPAHVGATGGDAWHNAAWYARALFDRGMGWGALMVPAGLALLLWRRDWQCLAVVALPAVLLLLIFITQVNVWQRWLILPLPALALLAGAGICAVAQALARQRAALVTALVAAACTLPLALKAHGEGTARANPTQGRAVAYALRHVPAGSSITMEPLAFGLLKGDFAVRYPFGAAGCVDGRQLLAGRVDFGDAAGAQRGKQKLVLGTIDPARIATCQADYVLIHDADRWLAEAAAYPAEAGIYRAVLAAGRIVAQFTPQPGVSAGPRTLLIRLDRPLKSCPAGAANDCCCAKNP
jgi:hypothetical protein